MDEPTEVVRLWLQRDVPAAGVAMVSTLNNTYETAAMPARFRSGDAAVLRTTVEMGILKIYDAMAQAGSTSIPYQTRLGPPPANPRRCRPPRRHSEEALA